ncbi:recombination protein NinB [Chitinilyticum litopenaei]|uniref:recombination protein NinB n=1 Tax=Chitinilyticum litopenaei TaxID=1121276 RepID=UPI0003F8B07C|nr:recombination protein NinB [Chitinilyticum litopenaei]
MQREFILNQPSVWQAFMAFIRQNAKAAIASGKPLMLIVTTADKKRNNEQNRRYWKAVLQPIAQQAWVAGRQYSAEVWHEHYARKFGVCEDMTLPNGEVVTRRKSTTEMTVAEFSEYMQRVEADAASELGVLFEVGP